MGRSRLLIGALAALAVALGVAAVLATADEDTSDPVAATAPPSSAASTGPDEAPTPETLLVVRADRGTVADGALTLDLAPDDAVTWFTDRPARAAGSLTADDLVERWDALGFSDDPPNAELVAGGDAPQATVVELGAPTWSSDQRALAWPTSPIEGAAAPGTGPLADVALFVDGAGGATLAIDVVDDEGEPLPGVVLTVRVPQGDVGPTQTRVSDTAGHALVSALPAGTYELEAQLEGFGDWEVDAVDLTDGHTTLIEAVLEPTISG